MSTKTVFLIAVFFLTYGDFATAQQSTNIARMGFLGAASAPALENRLKAFRTRMQEFGYIEGKNIIIDYRYADGNSERIPELARELVSLNPNVILTYQTPSVLALKKLTRTIPIVFAMLSFPVENGIVDTFAKPGGNATGMTVLSEELNGKRLQLLKETVSKLTHVAVLSNPDNPTQSLEWKEIQPVGKTLKLKLQSVEVRSSKEFAAAFETIVKERAQALLFFPEAVFSGNLGTLIEFITTNRLPSMFEGNASVEAGGLMSYGPGSTDSFRRAAVYVDKILKGTKPAELPVQQPTKFELVINLKTAKQIGLNIPQRVLSRADRVIK